jgi:hypothetical protein
MKNINRFLVLGLIAAAAVFLGGFATTATLQEAEAIKCDRQAGVVVCGVCVNAAVIAQDFSQRCE